MRFAILRQADTGGPSGPAAPLRSSHDVTVHATAELAPPSAAVRVVFGDDGPRVEPGALFGTGRSLEGLVLVDAPSREAALAWLAAQADGSAFELRELGCANGLTGIPPASTATRPRFLVALRADPDTEAERAPPAERLERMGRRNDEAVREGLLLAGDGLRSSARATRVTVRAGQARLVDGPFAEAKELVAGFWLVQADRIEEVVAWVCRYPYAQDRPEVEVRPVRA